MMAYDDGNVFARILRGDLPCHRVFEDEVALAFMDVMPRVEGHTLVIPKRACRTLLDIDPADLAAFMPRVQRVAQGVMQALAAPGLTVQQFNEEAGGQVVFHLHVHLLPRYPGVALPAATGRNADPAALAALAGRIAQAIH